jgi:superfamily II DNA/RNA helicase
MITRGKLEVDVVSEGKFSSSRDRSPMRPAVVVLVPTRELAMQVGAQAEKFGAPLGIKNT